MKRKYEVIRHKYTVRFTERKIGLGTVNAIYDAYDTEDLAEQFFAEWKNIEYDIVKDIKYTAIEQS